jgi:hypothetical protein
MRRFFLTSIAWRFGLALWPLVSHHTKWATTTNMWTITVILIVPAVYYEHD